MRRIAAKVFLSELLLQLVQPFHPKLLPALCCSKKSLNVPTGATQVWADGALPLTRSKSHCKTQAIWMLLAEASIIRYFRNLRCLHSGYQPRKHFFSGFFRLSLFLYKVLCPRAAIFPAFFCHCFCCHHRLLMCVLASIAWTLVSLVCWPCIPRQVYCV
jgi:hypothetical protein